MMRRIRRRDQRVGLTLLEVMLALAILGGAIAIIGELMRVGARNAEAARDLTTAQLHCETKINEIVAGLIPAQTITQVPIEDGIQSQGEWLYSILVQQVDQEGLISVTVTVEQSPDVVARPLAFALTRWMIDPMMETLESTMTQGAASGSAASGGMSSGF